jgi:hypothetical protein
MTPDSVAPGLFVPGKGKWDRQVDLGGEPGACAALYQHSHARAPRRPDQRPVEIVMPSFSNSPSTVVHPKKIRASDRRAR